jgi:hypothetical protein
MRRAVSSVVAALCVVLAAGGCSGGGDDGPDPAPSAGASTTTPVSLAAGVTDPCALLSAQEVGEAVGMTVQPGVLLAGTVIAPPGGEQVAAPSCEFRLPAPRDNEAVVVRVSDKGGKGVLDKVRDRTKLLNASKPVASGPPLDFEGEPGSWEAFGPGRFTVDCEGGASHGGQCAGRVEVAKADAEQPRRPAGGVERVPLARTNPNQTGAVSYCLSQDAARGLRGHEVTVEGFVRTDQVRGESSLLALADVKGQFSVGQSEPLTGTHPWTPARASVIVGEEADSVCVAVVNGGVGTTWADDVVVTATELLDEDDVADEDAEPPDPELRWQVNGSAVWARAGERVVVVQVGIRADQDWQRAAEHLARTALPR